MPASLNIFFGNYLITDSVFLLSVSEAQMQRHLYDEEQLRHQCIYFFFQDVAFNVL